MAVEVAKDEAENFASFRPSFCNVIVPGEGGSEENAKVAEGRDLVDGELGDRERGKICKEGGGFMGEKHVFRFRGIEV